MILIYTANKNIVVASNEIIENGMIKIKGLKIKISNEYIIEHTNIKVIPNIKPGKYQITVLANNEKIVKTITISN